jgi:high affinity choline transporter 7
VSFASGFGCLLLSGPPILIGFIAQSVVPSNYTAGHFTVDQAPLILPLVLRYLTNGPVMFLGLGSVAAGVMASSDGSILSASSMFANNIYKGLIRRSVAMSAERHCNR